MVLLLVVLRMVGRLLGGVLLLPPPLVHNVTQVGIGSVIPKVTHFLAGGEARFSIQRTNSTTYIIVYVDTSETDPHPKTA